ncbi:Fic family protein [Fusicatenibacter saccharivorans]|uniref:Fic family protein n=1 Tax=Fusicatenibacter saccharivorans TaxID=1150298 RepID=UPI003D044187
MHLRFEEIHPFAGGNGRVGRTLLNYYLMTHDYPPMILYSEDKRTYYMALLFTIKRGRYPVLLSF